MDTVKKVVQSSWFIPTLTFLIVFLLIWFAGPYVAFAGKVPLASISNRIIVIISCLLIYAIYKLIRFHLATKSQKEMISEMSSSDSTAESIDAEQEELKAKFNKAFGLLKSKKLANGSFLDSPWYMIIGAPGSGKTTLLQNSGLQFPLADELSAQSIKGVGGTKNCDWWITEQAILLDTAGRYTTQDSHQKVDQSGWLEFLSQIKKYRKKPLNGMIISLSMSDLLTFSEYELDKHLLQIKQRITEVNEFFDTNLPLYIMITKSDMLAGFSQFFDPLSHKEREQTFGMTFSHKQFNLTNYKAEFHQKFSGLLESMSRRQWQRVSLERDPSQKSLLLGLVNQISTLESSILDVLGSLLKSDSGKACSTIRGVYFTSGTQYGTPIDRILNKVSADFSLKRVTQSHWMNEKRSYFIKDLLESVIFPEADQFGVSANFDRKGKRLKQIGILACVCLTVLMSAGLIYSYSNNARHIETAESLVDEWQNKYEKSGKPLEASGYIAALNDFDSNIQALTEQQQESFLGFGLSQSNNLINALNASYERLIRAILLPYTQTQLEKILKNTDSPIKKYQALKTYLMLANLGEKDPVFLKNWLKTGLYEGGSLSEKEIQQLAAHFENLVDNNLYFENVDRQLIASSQKYLLSQPLNEIFYQAFKQLWMKGSVEDLSMAQLAGGNWRDILTTTADTTRTMPRIFTPEQFHEVTDVKIKEYLEALEQQSWVFGENFIFDNATIAKKMKNEYVSDYVQHWRQLLTSVSITQVETVGALNQTLQEIGQSDSPLFLLLDSIANATRLVDPSGLRKSVSLALQEQTGLSPEEQQELVESPEYYVTSQFSDLHDVMEAKNFAELKQKLATIVANIALAMEAESNGEIAQGKDDLLQSLDAFGLSQPDVLKNLVMQLSSNIGQVRSANKKYQLTKIWKADVLPTCSNAVAYKYPFSRSATTDASVIDFNKVFGNQGAVLQFFDTYLKPLTRNGAYPYRWKNGVSQAYGFNDNVLAFFNKIAKVRQSLYANNAEMPTLDFYVKPVYLDANLAKFELSIQGANTTYQFGRPITKSISWPQTSSNKISKFSFIRRDGSAVSKTKDGEFSFFRLLDEASIERQSGTKVHASLEKDGFKAIYEIEGKLSTDPMVFSNLANFKCLAEL